MANFSKKIEEELRNILRPKEGICGICHTTAGEVCKQDGRIVAYERPNGTLAKILDDAGEVIGEGFDIVWSPAVLAAELDAGLIPDSMASEVEKEGTNSKADIERVAGLYGYGRVITPAVVALNEINALGGRTIVKREGLGVVAIFRDAKDEEISRSPITYCPTCAVVIGAGRTEFLREKIKRELKGAKNMGKIKYELGIENSYELKGGSVKVTLRQGDKIFADKVLGCCIAYSTVKAEIVAGIVSEESSELFKAYCNLCPLKHCWTEKPMGAMGNIVLDRLSELGIEIEITARGGIVARIPGNGIIEGRGTLCSLSALTNMLLRGDAQKILKPSPVKRW